MERVNSDRITYAPPPPDTPPIHPFAASTQDVLAKSVEGQTYVVDRLIGHRLADDGSLHFNVKWADYDKPSWQPRSDVPEELISRYFAKVRVSEANAASS